MNTLSSNLRSRGLKGMVLLAKRHLEAIWFVLTAILPSIFRTGRRPVVFDKHSGIGDIICTFPAALELKKRHPKSPFIYNCHSDYGCLPKLGGITTNITSFRDIGLIRFWYRFLLSEFYNFASDDDVPDVDHSESYIEGYARRHSVTVENRHPVLRMEAGVLAKVKATLEKHGIPEAPMIVIHPGPTLPVKEWPREAWTALVQMLRTKGFTNIIQLGVGKVLRFGEVDIATIRDTLPLVNRLTLEESIALISLADLFIGVDSGLLHSAAAVRTPAVGVWGATSARFLFSNEESRSFVTSRVACQGCHHRAPRLHWFTGCPFDIACMKSISVDEVFKACLSEMESAGIEP